MKRKYSPLEEHYYMHAPKGMGADPASCVACAHTHPELEKKIDDVASRVARYSLYSVGFIVLANILSEWGKRKIFKNPYSRYPKKIAKNRRWAKLQVRKQKGKKISEFGPNEWRYVNYLQGVRD